MRDAVIRDEAKNYFVTLFPTTYGPAISRPSQLTDSLEAVSPIFWAG